jgi:hypothetical protein
MPIAGYELPWQVVDHLAALKRERLQRDAGTWPLIDREIARFEAELELIRSEKKAQLKREFEAELRATDV